MRLTTKGTKVHEGRPSGFPFCSVVSFVVCKIGDFWDKKSVDLHDQLRDNAVWHCRNFLATTAGRQHRNHSAC